MKKKLSHQLLYLTCLFALLKIIKSEETRASSSIGSFNYETFWGNTVAGKDVSQNLNSFNSFGILGDDQSQNLDIYYDRYFTMKERERNDPQDDQFASQIFDLFTETYAKDMRNRCYHSISLAEKELTQEKYFL